MNMAMNDDCIISIAQVTELIKVAEAVGIDQVERTDGIDEVYGWMNDLLIRLRYRFLKKKEKGVMRRYLVL